MGSKTSFPTSDPELVPPPLQVVLEVLLQLLPLPKKLPKKKRKKNQRRNPMMTWDSDFSTKVAGSNLKTQLFLITKDFYIECPHYYQISNFCIMHTKNVISI